MKNTKNSVLKLGGRKPYEPITRVFDLPAGLLEMATLIEKAIDGNDESLRKAAALQESIIRTALDNPTLVMQIRNLLANGYEPVISMAKSGEHGGAEDFKTSEDISQAKA